MIAVEIVDDDPQELLVDDVDSEEDINEELGNTLNDDQHEEEVAAPIDQ